MWFLDVDRTQILFFMGPFLIDLNVIFCQFNKAFFQIITIHIITLSEKLDGLCRPCITCIVRVGSPCMLTLEYVDWFCTKLGFEETQRFN